MSVPDLVAADDLLGRLEQMSSDELDALPFGVIGFDVDDRVTVYNATESAEAGLDAERVLGLPLFTQVAPCTDTDRIAGRFRTEERLDEVVDFVFTLRMKPTPVRLRLLASPDVERRYMVVTWPERTP